MTKLTLRDLFAIVTIVALALGWWLDHRRMAGNEAAIDRLVRRQLGYSIGNDSNGSHVLALVELDAPPLRDQSSQSK